VSLGRDKRPRFKATVFDKRRRILSVGYNSYDKTSPVQARLAKKLHQPERIFLHAEIAALIRVRHGNPYKILIERYDDEGRPMLAAPCPICTLAIRGAGIEKVEYTMG